MLDGMDIEINRNKWIGKQRDSSLVRISLERKN